MGSDGTPDTEGNEIESDIDLCVCGAVGRQHRRSCPLSYRNRRTGRTLFPAASSAGPSASPIADSATSDNVTPPPSKAEMKVGEGFQRSEWCKKHGRDAYGGSIADDEDESHHGKVKESRRGKAKLKKASVKPKGEGLCRACGSSTHKCRTHRDCPYNTKHATAKTSTKPDMAVASPSQNSDAVSDISDVQSETGGIDSDDCMMYDLCTCGSSGRAHKRDCLMNFRKRHLPQSPRESKPDTARSPSLSSPGPPSVCPEPECVVIDDASPPPTEQARPQIKVGDYVSVHSRGMGSSHLPCRVVGEFDGRYQLYCSKGVLNTTFSRAEVIPMARCTPIPMEEWRQAPKVSLRSVASDSAIIEPCNCQIPVCSEDTDIISVSEDESEAPVMWVNNGAYCLSHSDQEIVLSRRGWLTDKIIHAAQILLLQFFPDMAGLQPPVLQKVFAFQVHSGEFVQIIHVRNNHWCVVSTVGCETGVVRVYDSLCKTISKETVRLIASLVYSPCSELRVTTMDVEKQSNSSDCGVLGIAYAFDLCSGLNPCTVRFDHSKIRSHLAMCLENCQVSRFPVLGERKSAVRKPKTVELHCSCRMPEEKGDEMVQCDVCHVWYHRHCMDIPSEVFGESDVHWECKYCVQQPAK